MPFYRKQPRLPAAYYIGHRCHFVTICCDLRRPYLGAPQTAHSIRETLLSSAARHAFLLHAYCLMPDHLHILAQGAERVSDLPEFVRAFKLRTAFHFRKSMGLRLWEKSYYEHILRTAESLEPIACYIWSNPIRKQLCQSPWEFPYSGSQTIPWPPSITLQSTWVPPWKKQDQPV